MGRLADGDPDHLLDHQYAGPANLNARIALHDRFSTSRTSLRRWLFDRLLGEPADAVVLEVGCGSGVLWVENADRVPTGWRVTLTDVSPGMIDACRAVVPGSAAAFAEDEFDVVIAHGMLYHVPGRPAALAELRRVLRPEGALHAWTMGRGHLREIDELARRHHVDTVDLGDTAAAFGLESGRDQLEPWFGDVRLDIFDDSLEVTEVEPLVAYVRSWGVDEGALTALREEVRVAIARDGSFHVTKRSGVFICR